MTKLQWIKISLLNLVIIAFIGVILRYKIQFYLPFVDQKHLLHGHSHFAFTGWIAQALMALMVAYLPGDGLTDPFKKYKPILLCNLISAYGMLVSFPLEGYGLFSIIFSTLSIFVSYWFAIIFWKDLNKSKPNGFSNPWFKVALFCNVFSSLGAFALTLMMIQKVIHQNWYLAAEYFFLHFQYNGWFFFACMGLFYSKLNIHYNKHLHQRVFILFALAVIPAYFLSALWMNIPIWVYVLVALAAGAQFAGYILFVKDLIKNKEILKAQFFGIGRVLIILSAIALCIKLVLQLGSTYPPLSTLAFGFRPIVIGYLHLVLLGVITLFILGYLFVSKFIILNKKTTQGALLFLSGIIINQVLLMTQGVAAITYTHIPYINVLLLFAAFLMFSGIFTVFLFNKQKA